MGAFSVVRQYTVTFAGVAARLLPAADALGARGLLQVPPSTAPPHQLPWHQVLTGLILKADHQTVKWNNCI